MIRRTIIDIFEKAMAFLFTRNAYASHVLGITHITVSKHVVPHALTPRVNCLIHYKK